MWYVLDMPLSKARNRDRMSKLRESVQPSPRGMTKKFLTIEDRKAVLTDIALNGNTKLANPVEAIREYNRMEGSYAPIEHNVTKKIQFEVSFVPKQQIIEGEYNLLPEATESTGEVEDD